MAGEAVWWAKGLLHKVIKVKAKPQSPCKKKKIM